MKIDQGECQELSKRPVSSNDSQDRPFETMVWKPCQTKWALPASSVYFADYPSSYPVGPIGCLLYLTDEFMPRNSYEWVITLRQFQICLANPGKSDSNQRFSRQNFGSGDLIAQLQFAII